MGSNTFHSFKCHKSGIKDSLNSRDLKADSNLYWLFVSTIMSLIAYLYINVKNILFHNNLVFDLKFEFCYTVWC